MCTAALRVYSAGVEEQLAHAPVVQAAVRGIFDDLVAAGEDSAEVVHQQALDAAADFVKLFP